MSSRAMPRKDLSSSTCVSLSITQPFYLKVIKVYTPGHIEVRLICFNLSPAVFAFCWNLFRKSCLSRRPPKKHASPAARRCLSCSSCRRTTSLTIPRWTHQIAHTGKEGKIDVGDLEKKPTCPPVAAYRSYSALTCAEESHPKTPSC